MNTIELIEDAALFGGTVPNNRMEEVREFINDLKSKALSIDDVSVTLDSLIDRLEKASNTKYPHRQWTDEFKRNAKVLWKDKYDSLLKQVLKLEGELNER